ncbi:TonB family protein [Pontibacter chinhatensis]|uniref:TonB family C-terminal domain-containing protein n=1 Tax=Pontibacter chinhatensis TaxID=1436961 RepID=A0A1I2X096_9BACT|nr:TonB family protein [Pontibacter chinhatensis]SFH06970.1 TonB family C-terminal domain-containing protein [Pontibacter chinhatensis]
MPRAKHHILWPDGDHPSLELLRQYQHGDLPPALHHQLERHLLDCAQCADVLEGMAASDVKQTSDAVADINQRIRARVKQGKKRVLPGYWQRAAAILILATSAILVLYYNYTLQQPGLELAQEETVLKPAAAPQSIPPLPSAAATVPDSAEVAQIPAASIAAVVPGRKYTSPVVKQDAEEVYDQEVLEERFLTDAEAEVVASEAKSVEPGYLAGVENVTENRPFIYDTAAAVLQQEQKPAMALAPESTDVSKALAGKAVGITLRGRSTVKPENTAGKKLITGQVLSPEGKPLPGVAVTLKNQTAAVTTDEAGKYSLPVPAGEHTLRFSYLGYETAERALAGKDTSANVTLAPDQRALSEVVVTGNGTAAAPKTEPARPAAGMNKYKKYLRENSRPVPEQGKVKIAFTVATNGKPQHLRVVESLCAACDAEALRLVQEGPAWKPATRNGQAVPQEVKITIQFKK